MNVKFGELTAKTVRNTYTGSNDYGKFSKMGIDMNTFFKPVKSEELLNIDRENGGFKTVS